MVKKINQDTVLVSGHFNVLHPGHIRLLRFARECGSKLIVAVESDRVAGDAAYIPEELRLQGVQSNSYVNEAFIMDEPIDVLIKKIRPGIVVKGKEHEGRINGELEAINSYGGRLVFSSGETFFSSHDLLQKEIKNFPPQRISIPSEYMQRHGIDKNKLLKIIDQFQGLKILVLGDLIVDEYINCQPLGMSQEDPTLVVTPLDSAKFIGGAGIVACHAAGLGASVKFISIVGNDDSSQYAAERLNFFNVSNELLIDETRPTTLKQRYRAKGKSLLRVSHLHQGAISLSLQNKIINLIRGISNDIDMIVFSDFNYGVLPQSLVDQIVGIGMQKNIFLVADSQSSSQSGNICRFKGMDLITPTEHEARQGLRNNEDGLVVLVENLQSESNAKNILLKMGEEGLLTHSYINGGWVTDKISALNESPKDVAGAGDSLLIVSSMSMLSGGNIWDASLLGSIAAGVQVSRVGNIPLSKADLLAELS
jgi:rfaE bifunctional protein kinase chain/domain